jgi:predicted GH43/DUF377 family glycosyl hydrolase
MSSVSPIARTAPEDGSSPPLLRRTGIVLRSDPRRVIARLFLPGQETVAPGHSRATGVVERCLAMSEQEVRAALEEILTGYAPRHRHLLELLDEHYQAVAHRVVADALSTPRRRLIGAYFTLEYALEAAALFNPSLVAHPDQDGGPGELRLLMSARAVGEGHLSGVVFRTGRLDSGPGGPSVTMDTATPYVSTGVHRILPIDRERIRREAAASGADPECLWFALDGLPDQFSPDVLESALIGLENQRLTRVHADATARHLREAASGSYEVLFPGDTDLSERALLPAVAAESHGMEDARFLRFTDDDAGATYLATYTAFDGAQVTPRRLQTDDFRTFRATRFTGAAATDKGMALFPRRIAGRYLALSRWDRENNAIAWSDDGFHWPEAVELQSPQAPWELVQLGNCGSPLETPAGWLVLTHGVGPMRAYAIGALLLDRADPTRVIGRLGEPLLIPSDDERDGYVPNVVYSCGALLHDQTVVLPYGCSDSSIRLALLDLPALLALLHERS